MNKYVYDSNYHFISIEKAEMKHLKEEKGNT